MSVLSQANTNNVARQIQTASRLARAANWLTFNQVPDIRLANQVLTPLTQISQQNKDQNVISQKLWQKINDQPALTQNIFNDLQNSWLINYQLDKATQRSWSNFWHTVKTSWPEISQLITGPSQVLIVFQNQNELRAGGGFMGSYALIKIQDGKVSDISFEDIYDADGQFSGFMAAPPGVKEYLSSDRGMRLPDANWSADPTQAAKDILSYFSLGKRIDIDLLVMTNQQVLADLLKLTGPVYLPDYQTTVTAENFNQLLQDRGNFFPGSREKTSRLQSLFNQLKIKLSSPNLALQTIKNLAPLSLKKKDLYFYSNRPTVQAALQQLSVTADFGLKPDDNLLYLLESNVGINKVNQFTQRNLSIKPATDSLILDLQISNQATSAGQTASAKNSSTAPRLDYVNYQRLVMPASWQINTIAVNDKKVEKFDEIQIQLNDGYLAKQVGFLLSVAPSTQLNLHIELKTPGQINRLRLVRQPGQEVYPVNIILSPDTKTIMLDHDQTVSW